MQDFKDYEVKCPKCSKMFTVTEQSLNKGLSKRCPHCGEGVKTNMHKGKKLGT